MRRVLGLRDLVLIAAAAIGPAFSLATSFGPMVAQGTSATPGALAIIAGVMLCIAGGYRRLGARFPNAGSSFTWVAQAFGPTAGAYAAWILIVANIFAIVATAAPAGAYTLAFLAPDVAATPQADALIGAGWVLAAGFLLWRGMAPTSRVANILALVELGVIVAAAVAGFVHAPVARAMTFAPAPGFAGLAGALTIGIWMIDGWEVSASTAEEAVDGAAAPGIGGLLGLALTAGVLVVATASFVRLGTPAGFAAHEGDALAYAGAALGPAWHIGLTLTVLVSLAAALQATLIYLSRSIFAMGRAGVVPALFGRLDARSQPAWAVWTLTLLGIAGTLGSGISSNVQSAFAFILSGTSVFTGALFIITAAAAVRLFWNDRGARMVGAVLPAAGALALMAIVVTSLAFGEGATRAFALTVAVLGIPFALWRGRRSLEKV